MTKKSKPQSSNRSSIRSAKLAVSSYSNSATVIREHSKNFGDQDIEELMAELVNDNNKISKGDLQPIESMLFNQAKALELIFTKFARGSAFAQFNETMELNLKLALKAQAQCTRTLATLHAIKAPSNVSFVKQANIGGNVQVNNACDPSHQSQKKNENSTNELLEATNEQRLDSGEKSEAIEINTTMEALDKVNRA